MCLYQFIVSLTSSNHLILFLTTGRVNVYCAELIILNSCGALDVFNCMLSFCLWSCWPLFPYYIGGVVVKSQGKHITRIGLRNQAIERVSWSMLS